MHYVCTEENMKHLVAFLALLAALQVLSQVQQEWVVRYNNYHSQGWDEPVGLVTDNLGNIYVAGSGAGNNIIDSWEYEYVTIKYNSNGVQQWLKRFNRDSNQTDMAINLTIDNLGNVYVTGTSSEYYTDPGNIVILKYNSSGTLLWNVVYEYSYAWNVPRAIHTDNYGNCYVSCQLFNTNSKYDYGLLKYNSDGIRQWTRTYSLTDSSYDYAVSSCIDMTGNIYITGYSNTINYYDIVTMKYNSSGVMQWSQIYNSSYDSTDYSYSVAVDSSGNVYVGGFSQNSTGWDIIVLKYNSNGVLRWVKNFPGPKYINWPSWSEFRDKTVKLCLDKSKYLYVASCTKENLSINSDIAVLKYDTTGLMLWSRTFGSTSGNSDYAKCMTVDTTGNVYVSCYAKDDYLTLKYSNLGDLLWQIYYNGANRGDYPTGICLDYSGNIIITGLSESNNTFYDFATIKYSQPIGIQPISTEIPNKFSLSQNYPNPFNPTTKIRFNIPPLEGDRGRISQLIIYDVLGMEIKTLVNEQLKPGTYEVEFDPEKSGQAGLPSGVYFYKLFTNGFSETKKMVLLK